MSSRWRFLVFCTLLGAVTGITASAVFPSRFEARTLLLVKDTLDEGEESGDLRWVAPVQAIVSSHIEAIESAEMVEIVVKNMSLADKAAFVKGAELAPGNRNIMRYLSDNLDAKRMGNSAVIDLRFHHANPEITAATVNRLARLYQGYRLQEKIKETDASERDFENRLAGLAVKWRNSAKMLKDFQARGNPIDGAQAELTSRELETATLQLATARAELAAFAEQPIKTNAANKTSFIDKLIHTWQFSIFQTSDTRKILPAHMPDYRIDFQTLAMKSKIQSLEKKLEVLENNRDRENRAAIDLRELQQAAQTSQRLYRQAQERLSKMRIKSEFPEADIKVLAIATKPSEFRSHGPYLKILGPTLAGFLVGFFILLFKQQRNKISAQAHII